MCDRASTEPPYGDVVPDCDMGAADDPLELERGATGARERVEPDRDLGEARHPLVARALEGIGKPPCLGTGDIDQPAASKRSSTGLAS